MRMTNRSTSRRGATWAAFVMGVLLGAGPASATVPTVINYQGRLTDNTAQQNPVDATLTMDFSMWDAAASGTSLWSETQSVRVENGLFNVLLGSTTPIAPSVFSGGATRSLEIHVSGETLAPRQRIGAIPFANAAASADDAAALGGVGAAAFQRRIANPCPAGTSINAVGADGTVTCIAGQAGPQGPTGPPGAGFDTGGITGTLMACGGPVGGLLVYVPGRSAVAYTASDGTFVLSYLPAGTYDVYIGPGGSETKLTGVAVTSGQTTATGTTNWQSTAADVNNCGACGAACSTNHIARACASGSCETGACNAGFGDCNGDKRLDGCELNLTNTVGNCGGCGVVCSSNGIPAPTCVSSTCNGACALGLADCNYNKLVDGCEVNLSTSPGNCGACGLACSSNNIPAPTCSSAFCNGACASGFADCNGNKQADGCEVNLSNDSNNCGSCGHGCSGAAPTCSFGVCI